ncbi:MAG TPA: adenylyl-sulfate kinase [Egibacteraceae bacterium]|nr:adenylyl-sulfate kinase [Egibacteraceae bacterium]
MSPPFPFARRACTARSSTCGLLRGCGGGKVWAASRGGGSVEQGFVLWFTGFSGAGKSTIANRVVEELRRRKVPVELLDGDEVRTHLSAGLGFTKEDRDTNVLRIGWVAGLLSRHGVAAVTAAISPYADIRQQAREMATNFIEIFVDAPLEECRQRDVKGLYARADRGEIPNFTGVSDPYEPPVDPEVHLHTDTESVEESAQRVIDYLAQRKLVG